MKKKLFIILTLFSLSMLNVKAEEITNENILVEGEVQTVKYVASIKDKQYETLEEAIKEATKDDEIILLDDLKTQTITIDNEVTINAQNKTISATYLDINGKLTLKNANLNITSTGKYSVMMNNANAVFSLVNSNVTITGRGMYSTSGATINLDNTKFTIKDIEYVAWMQGDHSRKYAYLNVKNNSVFTINNVKRDATGGGNGLNWIYTTVDNAEFNIENCEYQGIVAGTLILKNNATASIKNTSYAHTMYASDEINVDSTSKLTITEARATGIWVWNGSITFQKGSQVDLVNNGNSIENEPDNMDTLSSSVIYLTKATAKLTIEDGANVNITNNYMRALGSFGVAYIGNGTNITNNGLVNPSYNKRSTTYGGGIFNAGTLTIAENVNIYNNHAELAADDIYNLEGSTIDFKDVQKDWILDDCDDKINSWYDDSENNRWNAHTEKEDELHIDKVSSGKKDNNLTIKAAHNLKAKVIAHYVDQDGNRIADDEIINGYVDDAYKTIQKLIEGYEFDKLEGNPEGIMTIKDIEVTYIYEFVKGQGDGEDPEEPKKEEEKPYTGVYTSSLNIIPFALSLSLGSFLVINRKKLIKEN